MATTDP